MKQCKAALALIMSGKRVLMVEFRSQFVVAVTEVELCVQRTASTSQPRPFLVETIRRRAVGSVRELGSKGWMWLGPLARKASLRLTHVTLRAPQFCRKDAHAYYYCSCFPRRETFIWRNCSLAILIRHQHEMSIILPRLLPKGSPRSRCLLGGAGHCNKNHSLHAPNRSDSW